MLPDIYWHSRDWSTISMRLGDLYFGYRRGERLRHADRVALRVTVGGAFEWTDAGREDFAENLPEGMQVEVTITGRRRATSVFEYRQPGSLVDRSTP